jgi:hypothetical protein
MRQGQQIRDIISESEGERKGVRKRVRKQNVVEQDLKVEEEEEMEFKILCLFQIKKSYTSAMHYILFGYCLEARPKELEMILVICDKLSCQGRGHHHQGWHANVTHLGNFRMILWSLLIDPFLKVLDALDEQLLPVAPHLEQQQAFEAPDAKTESTLRHKFTACWHLIQLLGSNNHLHLETVILQF